jgi:hypothetical protein
MSFDQISNFFLERLETVRSLLGEFGKTLEKIGNEANESNINKLIEKFQLEREYNIDVLKKHQDRKQKYKNHKIKFLFAPEIPIKSRRGTLNRFDVSKIKATIACISELIKKLEAIQKKHKNNNKTNMKIELESLRKDIGQDENDIMEIILDADNVYQKEKIEELKKYTNNSDYY